MTPREIRTRHRRGRRPIRTPAIAAIVVAALVATMAVVLPTGKPAYALDRPLVSTPIITWNMQGETAGGESIWGRAAGYARRVQIVLLQESGPTAPRTARVRRDIVTSGGFRVANGEWNPHTERLNSGPYDVFWIETDTNRLSPGRVNIAIVTVGTPDQVEVIVNPHARGRRTLGVRFGNDWYFSFHALSGGGPDSAQMLSAIDATVRGWNPNYRWTVGGDFNRRPADLVAEGGLPASANTYSTGMVTRQASGRELDYFMSSHSIRNLLRYRLAANGASDHNPVQLGGMRAGAEPVDLRHLAGGDSNTQGHRSSHGHGYLQALMYTVLAGLVLLSGLKKRNLDYVGREGSGDMEHEGVPGDTIEKIAARLDAAVPMFRPNVVMLMAGTNDMNQGLTSGAPQRLAALVDQILADSPGVTVVVAELIGAKNDQNLQNRINAFNDQIRPLIWQRQAAGKKVLLVNMQHLTADDMADTLHPNDAGYDKMAHAFAGGVMEGVHRGWITTPSGSAPVDCSDEPRRWEVRQRFAAGVGVEPRTVAFADMDGDGKDDYLSIGEGGSVDVWYNRGGDRDGKPGWRPGGRIAKGVGLDPYEQRLEFGDVAGDDRDDYLVVDKGTGAVDAYINQGGDKPDGTPGWSLRKNIAAGTPEATHGLVMFGDVAGDDKDDYIVRDSTITTSMGVMYAWENKGGDRPDGTPGWHPLGKIAQGVTRDVRAEFSLYHHDCDGKDDYWVLYPDGKVDVWINKGGDKPDGTPGWAPRGRTAAGTGSTDRITFADVDGDGRDDYLVVGAGGAVDAYLNRGGDPT